MSSKRAQITVPYAQLAELLQLPDGFTVRAADVDEAARQITLHVTHPDLRAVPDGEFEPELDLVYETTSGKRLTRVEGMPPKPKPFDAFTFTIPAVSFPYYRD